MNRIAKVISHLKQSGKSEKCQTVAPNGQERKSVSQTISGQPTTCSFCCNPCNKKFSKYNAISPDGNSLICSNCITYLNTRVALGAILQSEGSDQAVEMLHLKIQRMLVGQPGTIKMKRVAADLAVRICRQSTDMHDAQRGHCKYPSPLRFLVKGSNSENFFGLLKMASEQAGITALESSVEDFNNGKTEHELSASCHNDNLMMEHSVVFVNDGPVVSDARYTLVYICDSDKSIDLDGYDSIELT